MSFRGLFIGIDRYASSSINWLRCARRDAVALHALFTDTLGGGANLLTDGQATRAGIEAQFGQLAACNEDDVVVIAFSGHGSETHELVTYDTDVVNLGTTAIPLDILTEWFSRIPARRLLCVLDCCFSGGMGAKVLRVKALPRSLASADEMLERMSGDGRLIFTAATATEPAFELPQLGHGLLTNYLLEALQGATEVRQAGKVSIYRLLEYVTQRVIDGAAQIGKPQHPTLRGQMDGELTWPIFIPGPCYQAAFPERMRQPVSMDVQSLACYGFPPALIAAWGSAIPGLNQLQLEAINNYHLLDGESLVVSAPTSSGKTMIGELAALHGALERQRSFFLLPLKALVNDKHQQFVRTYGDFGLRTIRATGEVSDDVPALMRGQYDICLMTYEKFAALVLGSPHILEQVGTIVVDEVQMIADESRGANLEFILTLLRLRGRQGPAPQLVTLSAVIGDTNGLERWLGARLLRSNARPVPLDEGILRADGGFRFIDPDGKEQEIPNHVQRIWLKNSSQDWIIPLVRRLVGENKQVIVFRETKGEARGCALYLAEHLGLPPAQTALEALPAGDLSNASEDLRKALVGGVAFHNANLSREERLVVEEQFRAQDTTLRVIAATTTLAMGINTPASAVIIAGLEHPGPQPYSIAEYKNIVGRAGRLGYAERGTSYLLALSPHVEHYMWTRYVKGNPEDLQSRFLAKDTDPRTLMVRVLVAAGRAAKRGMSAKDIIDFLEGSFGAYQQMQTNSSWRWDEPQLLVALANLESHRLVERDGSGNIRLTQLGHLAGQAGVEVESVIRLVDALSGLPPAGINDQTLVAAAQLTMELDDVLFPINKKSTIKEPQTWANELQHQQVASSVLMALSRTAHEPFQGVLRAKKAVGCLLWMTDMPIAQIERVLTQFGPSLDGAAGPVRAVAARTCDLLPVVARVWELLHPGRDLTGQIARLVARLEAGVTAAGAEIALCMGARLTRGVYQRFISAGLGTVAAIEASSDEAILACLDGHRNAVTTLAELRRAVQTYQAAERESSIMPPILPLYES